MEKEVFTFDLLLFSGLVDFDAVSAVRDARLASDNAHLTIQMRAADKTR